MNYYEHHIGDFDVAIKTHELPMVYVLTTPNFQYLKIGKSRDFKQRLVNIQSGCPFDLDLWLAIRTPKPSKVECRLHALMKHAHVRGEWFSPKPRDLDYLLDFFQDTNLHIKGVRRALLQT